MAKKQKVDLEERIPWDGENHKEQGYSEPTVTTSMMEISPELLKGNIKAIGKEAKQDKDIRSNEIIEGMIIKASDGGIEKGASKGD